MIYLLFAKKEPFSSIIYKVKDRLRYMAIPATIVFVVVVALPFFVPIKSRLFTGIVVLVMAGWGFTTLMMMGKLSKQNENQERKEHKGK